MARGTSINGGRDARDDIHIANQLGFHVSEPY